MNQGGAYGNGSCCDFNQSDRVTVLDENGTSFPTLVHVDQEMVNLMRQIATHDNGNELKFIPDDAHNCSIFGDFVF